MIGILTTWNQECGLATYASFLASELEPNSFLILGEKSDSADQESIRCWKRQEADYSELEQEIEKNNIKTLVLNCHYRFFNQAFFNTLERLKRSGLRVFSIIHNPFTVDPALSALVELSDGVIVHTEENSLEIIANGGVASKTHVIEHGVADLAGVSRIVARSQLGIDKAKNVIVTFGFIQPHKGIDQVLSAIVNLDADLYVVGGVHAEDPTSNAYLANLKLCASKLGISDRVHFVTGFVPNSDVEKYLRAADVVAMNYQSNYYEASGAVAKALGAGRAVITSTAPCFSRLGSTVFHSTTGYPFDIALRLVLNNPNLKSTLEKRAAAWTKKHSWKETVKQILSVIGDSKMKVLFQNRANARTQPGGDTVVMDRVATGLRAKGVQVDIVLDSVSDYSSYDLVHLFNFATPELTERYARDCVAAKKPYVVTALYEDRPKFYNQMFTAFDAISSGKQGQLPELLSSTTEAEKWSNNWTAEHANVLFATGASEVDALSSDYPNSNPVTFPVGCEVFDSEADEELFAGQFGVRGYVLCVGRLETRKNQLALLKALESDQIPVVLVDGGFTYQPEYEQACRSVERSGRTIFTGRLSPEMLASAYKGAKVHALPSWYELPGLVSLEAARYGANVVVSELGTSKDYFNSLAFYANPGDLQSIRNAVLAGFYAPKRPELVELAESFTWERSSDTVYSHYCKILKQEENAIRDINIAAINAQATARTVADVGKDDPSEQVTRLLDQADKFAKEGVTEKAIEGYQEALSLSPGLIRAHRSIGAVLLSQSKLEESMDAFEHALSLNSKDPRSLAGKAAIQIAKGETDEAFTNFRLATEEAPEDLSVILLFLNSAFMTGRYIELEQSLKSYLDLNPDDTNIRYCYAGCLHRQGRVEEAKASMKLYVLHGGNQEIADEFLEKIAEVTPTSDESKLIAEIEDLKSRGLYDEVIKYIESKINFESLSDLVTDMISVLHAECLALVGDLALAQKKFSQISEQSSSWARAQTGLGAVAASSEDWVTAKSYFETALNVSPELDSALAGMGVCFGQANEKSKAFSYFSKALDVNAENLRALLGIIELGYGLGELSTIERHVEAYLEFHPGNLNILYAKAGCLYSQGRNEECLEILGQIKAFEPNHQMACELEQAILKRESHA